jgi:uncharacterized small protein (DUF1192 family)
VTLDPTLLIHEIGSARLDAMHWRTECARRDQRIAELQAEIDRLRAVHEVRPCSD